MTRASAAETVAVDSYVIDVLMQDLVGHDRTPAAFIVFLYLWRHSVGARQSAVRISLRDIADGTGLSKRGVQAALTVLRRRRLVSIAREGITEIPTYELKMRWRT